MKKILIAIALLIFAVTGLTLFFKNSKGSETAQEQLHTAHVAARHVAAEGKIEAIPGSEVEVGSEVTGRIERFAVKEGDSVKKGDIIAIIENRDIKARLKGAETEVDVARARLKEVASGSREEEIKKAAAALEGAMADMQLASIDLERFEKLFKDGMVSKAEWDQRTAASKVFVSRVKEAEETKSLLEKGPKAETLRLNEDMIKQAQANVELHRRLLDKTVIKAPISGKVIRKYVEEGELLNLVGAETLLAAIADPEKVRVNAEVDETDVGKIKVGDPADVTSDAYPGLIIKGEIVEIADYVGVRKVKPNNPAKNLDMKVIQVKILLREKTPLRLGMTVDVKIVPNGSE